MRTATALAAALLLALPAAASAHVTLQPTSAPADAYVVLDVRVPTERDDASTTKVEVQMADGIISASTQPVPGWTAEVTKAKVDPPIDVDGVDVDEQVGTITFTATGKGIGPGEFQDFPVSMKLPAGKAGDALTFKALQTYDDGEVVRWIGSEDSDNPAPTVTLTAAQDEAAHGAGNDPSAGGGARTAAPTGDGGDGGGDGLAVAALVLGALGLLAGGAALLTARRAVTAP